MCDRQIQAEIKIRGQSKSYKLYAKSHTIWFNHKKDQNNNNNKNLAAGCLERILIGKRRRRRTRGMKSRRRSIDQLVTRKANKQTLSAEDKKSLDEVFSVYCRWRRMGGVVNNLRISQERHYSQIFSLVTLFITQADWEKYL